MRTTFTRLLVGPALALPALTMAVSPGHAASASSLPPGVSDPCPAASGVYVTCAALVGTPTGNSSAAARAAATTPSGYGASGIRDAYDFQTSLGGSRQTVAIVTAYDDPDAESDLGVYRSQYNIPACTTADGCFKKVGQTGSTTSLPEANTAWAVNLSQSMDMISAVCPNCHILVVEANDNSIANLGPAENEAVALGAKFIDNDWYTTETSLGTAETSYDSEYFDHPGVAITAPAGNAGYGVDYPAASQYVTAVGGTALTKDTSVARGWTETAWSNSGSGCSAYEPKPSWQTDTGCTTRSVADMAAVADPSTPVAFYDTPYDGGWRASGGTALSAAIVAAAYALAGTPAAGTYPASYPYQHPGGSYTTPGNSYPYASGLFNITSGSNGTCSPAYLCTAGAGYNGPTGIGTPDTQVSLSGTGSLKGPFWGELTNECLDDHNDTVANGNAVQVYVCDGLAGQEWTAEANGTIQLKSGWCLDIHLGGTADGTHVQLYTCISGDGSQQWTPLASGQLYNPQSGKCLDDPSGSTTNGTQFQIYTCNSGSGQVWRAPYTVPTSSGSISSQINVKKCVDDHGGVTTDGNPIDIYDCNGNAAQDFTIAADASLHVLGKCMATVSDGTADGTKIELWACTGDTGQRWIARSDGALMNVRSGTCLDDPSASTTNYTQLQIWTCLNDIQQSWTLP
jgi:hypothetical protein